MSLLDNIDNDIKTALKSKEMFKLTVLRGLKSDIKYKQIDKGGELNDDEILSVLSTAAKKRKEAIAQYQSAGRNDLVDKENSELKIIKNYLPEQLSEDKLRELVAASIEETGADSPSKIGLVMKSIMPKVKGKADGKLINKLVSEMLSQKSE